jgi:osomolarity two-component system sensor histidine kinase TcsA
MYCKDISMPVMDGVTATTHIREMGLQMPIIAITGNVLQATQTSTWPAEFVIASRSPCITISY